VDETQKVYTDYAQNFWSRIKSISETEEECRVHIVFFAVYGDITRRDQNSLTVSTGRGTPFIPNMALGADFLQCSLDETKALVADFSKRTGTKHLPEIAPVLHAFTGGHIGMIHALLEGLHRYFGRLTRRPYDLDAAMLYLLSVEALNAIRHCIRSPPDFANLSEDCLALVNSIIRSPDGRIHVEDKQLPAVHALMDRSIARWYERGEERLVCFISPAVFRIAISALCAAPRPEKEVTTLPKFLTQVLPKIRSDFLQNNLGVGVDALLEPVWQCELYRIATSALQALLLCGHLHVVLVLLW
jgi:hypothetical protein